MSTVASYAFLDQWVLDGLRELGVAATYQPINDITSPAGKIAGAAQTRRSGAVLHHVTMAYDIDTTRMLEVLRIGREKLSDKATQSAAKRVDPLRSQTGLPREEIIGKMIASFRRRHGLAPGKLHPAELERAALLVESKFSAAAWTGIVP